MSGVGACVDAGVGRVLTAGRLLSPCAGVQTCPTHQVSVENLPDVKGYASSDAFLKHPTIPGLYKVYVRRSHFVTLDDSSSSWPTHVCVALEDWTTS